MPVRHHHRRSSASRNSVRPCPDASSIKAGDQPLGFKGRRPYLGLGQRCFVIETRIFWLIYRTGRKTLGRSGIWWQPSDYGFTQAKVADETRYFLTPTSAAAG